MQCCLGHVLRNHKVVSKNKQWLLSFCLLGAVAQGILGSGVPWSLRGLGVPTWPRLLGLGWDRGVGRQLCADTTEGLILPRTRGCRAGGAAAATHQNHSCGSSPWSPASPEVTLGDVPWWPSLAPFMLPSPFLCLARKICLSSLERDTRVTSGTWPPWSQPSWALPELLGTVTWPLYNPVKT